MLRMDSQNLTSSGKDNRFSSTSTRNANFKTPARLLKHSRAVHDENSVYGHPRTAGLTNKKKHDISFNTPPINKVPRFAGKTAALTEITNRTPYIQRLPAAPLPASIKSSKPFVVFNVDSVAPSARRISSTRKKLKLPSSASKKFETPETRGNHWDVSDTSIEASIVETASITEEDYDDVEYGPPTAIDPKYDPGFDMPDYTAVGAMLMTLFRQSTVAEEYDPAADCDFLDGVEPLAYEEVGLFDDSPDDIFSFINQLESIHNQAAINLTVAAKNPQSRLCKSTLGSAATKPKVTAQKSGVSDTSKKSSAVKISSKPPVRGSATSSHTRIPSLSRPKDVQGNISVRQTLKPPVLSRNTNPKSKSTVSCDTTGKKACAKDMQS